MASVAASKQHGMVDINPLLLGTFHSSYDMPVIFLWVFILFAGFGNWLTFWTYVKTNQLQTIFNVIPLTLCFSHGLVTSMVSLMELNRITMSYPAVPVSWCQVKLFLTSFSSIVSIFIIFTLSAMRLRVAWANQAIEISKIKIYSIIIMTYTLAITGASLMMLDESSESIRSCMGRVTIDIMLPETPGEYTTHSNISNEVPATTLGASERAAMTTPGTWDNSSHDVTTEPVTIETPISPVAAMSLSTNAYFLIFTSVLLTATGMCYLCLGLILKKHPDTVQTLGNNMDILTLRVMAYVTCSFFASFLVLLFPVVIYLPPQGSITYMHYMGIFQCLSCMDSALHPLCYYFLNETYRKALQKALPYSVRKLFCTSSVTPDDGYHSNGVQAPESDHLPF